MTFGISIKVPRGRNWNSTTRVFLTLILLLFTPTQFILVWRYNNGARFDEVEPLSPPPDSEHSKPAVFAFITEPRCLKAVPFVLENVLRKLPSSFPVVFFYSDHNVVCVERWLNETTVLAQARQSGRLIIEKETTMDPEKKAIYSASNWNNKLYTNVTFWESLYQYGTTALTFQADSIICANDTSMPYTPLWNVNYLGGISWQKNIQPSTSSNTYHLNGGLSIRNLDWVISCLKNTTDFSKPEDDIFCNCKGGAQDVSILDAMEFSSDNGNTKCFTWQGTRRCPWGVHKPWMQRGNDYNELVDYCPDIEILHRLLTPDRPPRRSSIRR